MTRHSTLRVSENSPFSVTNHICNWRKPRAIGQEQILPYFVNSRGSHARRNRKRSLDPRPVLQIQGEYLAHEKYPPRRTLQ